MAVALLENFIFENIFQSISHNYKLLDLLDAKLIHNLPNFIINLGGDNEAIVISSEYQELLVACSKTEK